MIYCTISPNVVNHTLFFEKINKILESKSIYKLNETVIYLWRRGLPKKIVLDVIQVVKNIRVGKIFVVFICVLAIFTSHALAYADDFHEYEPINEAFTKEVVEASATPPVIEAGAAIVIDAKSGRVLYAKNADSRRPMASTTKIMTAIVAIEKGGLEDKVKVSKRAASVRGSVIHLRAGEDLTLRELLYGLMLNSGNDAAIAIAEHIGGTVENFAQIMTNKAKDIGLKDTAFKTPHGLDATGHYTTARELALLTRYALDNPVFSKIVSTQSMAISNRTLNNTNEMLRLYNGADGVKTGYTGKAGRCLVTTAKRGDFRIISVVLNCSSRTIRAKSSKTILDYGFDNYKLYTLLQKDQQITKIEVKKGIKKFTNVTAVSGVEIPLTLEEKNKLKEEISTYAILNAPVHEGIEVGTIVFSIDDKIIAQSDLKTCESISRKNFWYYWHEITDIWYRIMLHPDVNAFTLVGSNRLFHYFCIGIFHAL